MCEEARRWFPLETGGALAGYRVGSVQVITDYVGPGPRATRTSTTFESDHENQCEVLDQLFDKSCGVTVYLGDWHTHPAGVPNPSGADRRTMRRIARHRSANCNEPVMIIGGGGPNEWEWKAHLYQGTLLRGITRTARLIPYVKEEQ